MPAPRVIPSSIHVPNVGWVRPRKPGAPASVLRQAVLMMSAFLIVLAVLAVGGVGFVLLNGEATDYAMATTRHEEAEKALLEIPRSIDCIGPAIDRLAKRMGPAVGSAKQSKPGSALRPTPSPRGPAAGPKRCGSALASPESR